MSEDTQTDSSTDANTSLNGTGKPECTEQGSAATKTKPGISEYEISRLKRRKYERNVGFSIVGVLFIVAVLGWAFSGGESWESRYQNCMIGSNRNSRQCEDMMEQTKSTWKSVTKGDGKAQAFSLTD